MTFVMIDHKVANYAKWKREVKSAVTMRKAAGEKCFYACRNSKRPNQVMVWCEWDTMARAKKFMKSRELREGMKKAGVVGKPVISFFDRMDDWSVK